MDIFPHVILTLNYMTFLYDSDLIRIKVNQLAKC